MSTSISHSSPPSHDRWYCHFDDDVYVNIPMLVTTLAEYNPLREKVYIGRWPRPYKNLPLPRTKLHHVSVPFIVHVMRTAYSAGFRCIPICNRSWLLCQCCPHERIGRILEVGIEASLANTRISCIIIAMHSGSKFLSACKMLGVNDDMTLGSIIGKNETWEGVQLSLFYFFQWVS